MVTISTIENLKVSHLMEMSLKAQDHVLLVGPTGTGKSILVTTFLRELDPAKFISVNVTFSA